MTPRTPPKPGTPEYQAAVDLASKIEAMANKPVDELVTAMGFMGFPPYLRKLILEQMARHAMTEAANVKG
jgi:hypothetical protein